jgi:hypothetical protein
MPLASAEHLHLITLQRAAQRAAEPKPERPWSDDDLPLCEPRDAIEELVHALATLAPQEYG